VIEPALIALAAALVLGLAWRLSGRRDLRAICGLWAAYAAYEFLMFRRVLCSGDCNIRIDLLLIYPALIASLLWCAVIAIRRVIRRARRG
jgi:hypothetical protein